MNVQSDQKAGHPFDTHQTDPAPADGWSLLRVMRHRMDTAGRSYREPGIGHGVALRGLLDHVSNADASACDRVRQSLEMFASEALSSSLFRGVLGPAWLAMQMKGWSEGDRQQIDEMIAELDGILADSVENASRINIDIINGLAGIAVYASIPRAHNSDVSDAQSDVLVDAIAGQAALLLDAWLATGEAASDTRLANLGMAHGFPGLLAALLQLRAFRRLPETLSDQRLLDAVAHLRRFALARHDGIAFPNRIGEPRPGRFGWCYGSLGVAGVFLQAATLDPGMVEAAESCIAFSLHQFSAGAHAMTDMSLCHGWSGAAMILANYAQALPARSPLRSDCTQAVGMLLGGVPSAEEDADGIPVYPFDARGEKRNIRSLLEGAEGVALALIEARAPGTTPVMALLGYGALGRLR